MDGAARADAKSGAKLVGGEGDVAGGDFGAGIPAPRVGHRPFVQGKDLQDPAEAAEKEPVLSRSPGLDGGRPEGL